MWHLFTQANILQWGTHNALLALGENCFFEVIAPPIQNWIFRKRGCCLKKSFQKDPHLATWVVQCHPIQYIKSGIENILNIDMGNTMIGKRKKTDGSFLEWQLTDPYANRLDGAVPFLIDWGNSEHPSLSLPDAGTLEGLSIYSPYHMQLKNIRMYKELGIEIHQSNVVKLEAAIRLKNGKLTVIG